MMKELRVEDALLYLDQVKVEFGDRPHIYNEFLDIMKTFKTQQIDTPGVIRRVSNLFQGNRRLVLGFNTFLPEGYKIELPADGLGPPVAVYRAPGSDYAHVLNAGEGSPPSGSSCSLADPTHQATSAVAAVTNPPSGGPSAMRLPQQALNQARPMPIRGSGAPGPPPPPPHQQPPRVQGGLPQQPQQPMPGSAFAGRPQGPPQAPAPARGARSPMDQQVLQPGGPPKASPPQQQEIQGMAGGGSYPRAPAAVREDVVMGGAGQPEPPYQQHPVPPAQSPLEFDHAINYVTTIKKRFANEPETYKKFLEILHTYQKEQRGIKEVLDEVSVLFADHEDLLKQFTYFLPDAVQSQAKAQLDEAVRAAEQRKRSRAKQGIMQQAQAMQQQAAAAQRPVRPPPPQPPPPPPPPPSQPMEYEHSAPMSSYGAVSGRSVQEERVIIASTQYGTASFTPVRPPRMQEGGKQQQQGQVASLKVARPKTIPAMPISPNAAETAFFYRVKHHLSRKELAPDKPVGSKRHTPYMEFVKCLHLFGAGILSKEELCQLLRGLFTQGHAPKSAAVNNPQIGADVADLLREFEQIFVGRGPYANQEAARADRSKYGSSRARDMDFTDCDNITPSYWSYPSDYPASVFLVHPSRHHNETKILNDAIVAIPAKRSAVTDSLEAHNGIKKRQNSYEEVMARIEDERYEIDMAIARNAQALVQIEPLAQECLRLRQGEEKDGQPIGRLQYTIKRRNALTAVVINAIARVYGDRGDEVIQHLQRNPLIVLPIVYQRLKQKHDEWRKIKDSCKEQWKAITEANYEGCMDTQCHFRRRNLEKTFASDFLLNQCRNAGFQRQHSAGNESITFSIGVADLQHLFYEPCLNVRTEVGSTHKDAFLLLAEKVKRCPNAEKVDLERIGRIWAEFMVPWYGYPIYWVVEHVRQSFSGRLSQSVVKFALGQKVKTAYGVGTVTQFEGGKYRVKLPYGVAFLGPASIVHAVASKETPYIRRDGKMERDTNAMTKTEGPYLPEQCQVLFATRRIYLFLRLHLQLCNILSDLRTACNRKVSVDPATHYVVQPGDEPNIVSSKRLNYAGMIGCLLNVVARKCDQKTFETFGRKISKQHVHIMSALPRLVDRCAESLISLAKEDALLHLFDYCQYRGLNPSIVREHCFSMAPDADFRVQYDGKSTAFSYLPRGTQLPSGPRSGDQMVVDSLSSGGGNGSRTVEVDDGPDAMDIDSECPVNKRIKLS